MSLVNHLGTIAFTVLWALVSVGLFIALIRVSLGVRDGHRHLVGVVVVAAALMLWQAGVLGALVQQLVGLLSASSTASTPFTGASP